MSGTFLPDGARASLSSGGPGTPNAPFLGRQRGLDGSKAPLPINIQPQTDSSQSETVKPSMIGRPLPVPPIPPNKPASTEIKKKDSKTYKSLTATGFATLRKKKHKDKELKLERMDVPSVQPSPRDSLPLQSTSDFYHSGNEDVDPRMRIAHEILDTERSYATFLRLLVDVAITPLRQKKILSSSEITDIFSNVEALANVHTMFLQHIEQRVVSWNANSTIGDVFLKFVRFLQLQAFEFINNFDKSDKTLKKLLKKNKGLAAIEAELMAHPQARKLDFQSFLIMPVQRLPRYILLLEELLKKTNTSHPDYNNLRAAIDDIKSVSQAVNNKKAQNELNQRFIEITNSITGIEGQSLIKPSRQYVSELEVVFISSKGPTQQLLVLLNDSILFLTRTTNKTFAFTGLFPIKAVRMQAIDMVQAKFQLKNSAAKGADLSKCWPYWIHMRYEDTEYLLSVASEKDQTTLISSFETLKANVQRRYWKCEVAQNAPSPRHHHTFLYFTQFHKFLVYGGQDRSSFFSDVWLYDLEQRQWSQPELKGITPPALAEHSSVIVGDKVYIFGGHNAGNYLGALFTLDLSSMTFSRVETLGTQPMPRGSHSCTAIGTKLYVFGGSHYASIGETKVFDDLYCYDTETNTWTLIEPATSIKPPARSDHVAAAYNNKIFVFGGRTLNQRDIGDVWAFDLTTMVWSQYMDVCGFVPTPRSSTLHLKWDQFILLFGGDGNGETYSDLFLFNLETGVWSKVEMPAGLEPRMAGRAALIENTTVLHESQTTLTTKSVILYLFGGRVLRNDMTRVASNDLVSLELRDKWVESAKLDTDCSKAQEVLDALLAKQAKFRALNERLLALDIAGKQSAPSYNFVKRVQEGREAVNWDGSVDALEVMEVISKVDSHKEIIRGIVKEPGVECRIKSLHISKRDTHKLTEMAELVDTLKRCKNRSICRLYGMSEVRHNTLWLVSEYCGAGSIKDVLRVTNKPLTERQIATVCAQVLAGLSYLHSLNLAHKALKSSNILLTDDGVVKLGDFVISDYIDGLTDKRSSEDNYWAAPEQLEGRPATNKSDIYSLGIAVIEMCENTPPYKQLQKPKKFSNELHDFINQCLLLIPNKRPDATQLLHHPFIAMASPQSLMELVEVLKKQRSRLSLSPSSIPTLNMPTSPAQTSTTPRHEPVPSPTTPTEAYAPTQNPPQYIPEVHAQHTPQTVATEHTLAQASAPSLDAPIVWKRPDNETLEAMVRKIVEAEIWKIRQEYEAQIQLLQAKVMSLEDEVATLRKAIEDLPPPPPPPEV